MPIAHIDVLVTVPPEEPPHWLTARARRVVALAEGSLPAATLAELRARLPRLVVVFGHGAPAAAVATQVHDAGLPLVVFTDDPTMEVPRGIDVRPATDPGPPMEMADSLLDLVGETPLLALHRTARDVACHLLVKLEYMNPGGSVKDRPALAMIAAAEREGKLLPGGTIVEPTSGNTGVGLAMVAALRGYHCIFHDAGQDRQRKDATIAGVRGRGDRLPDGGSAGAPGVVLLGGGPGHGVDPGSLPTQPVPQPGEPGLPLPFDRPGDSGVRPPTASLTSWPASAPAVRSAGSAATSKNSAPRSRSSEPTRKGPFTLVAVDGPIWWRASAKTSGRQPTIPAWSTG